MLNVEEGEEVVNEGVSGVALGSSQEQEEVELDLSDEQLSFVQTVVDMGFGRAEVLRAIARTGVCSSASCIGLYCSAVYIICYIYMQYGVCNKVMRYDKCCVLFSI